ncbi:MAG: BlaI/MecI/CopY family transcriptional regulator [Gemmatimonadota bacterium]|nr:MAG: BlaI/MecI/CopY family transcriptional regulator [Gemmatimonadota bacterium]
MTPPPHTKLSRREREIMDIIYQLGETGVAEVVSRMRDNPTYDSVRVTLGILEKKGHVTHQQDGRRYLYSPTVPHQKATRNAMRNLLQTFFSGSPSKAIQALLDMSGERLSPDELDEIARWIEQERKLHDDDTC